ncbi:unnamed protein product, partial [Owenia fusiformis]
ICLLYSTVEVMHTRQHILLLLAMVVFLIVCLNIYYMYYTHKNIRVRKKIIVFSKNDDLIEQLHKNGYAIRNTESQMKVVKKRVVENVQKIGFNNSKVVPIEKEEPH